MEIGSKAGGDANWDPGGTLPDVSKIRPSIPKKLCKRVVTGERHVFYFSIYFRWRFK